MNGDREHCLSVGMDDYLAKPFTSAQLGEVIGRWVGHVMPAAPVPTPVVPPPAAKVEPAAVTLDPGPLNHIRALQRPGSPSLIARVIQAYLDDAPKLAREIHEAVTTADPVRLARAAHTLKSASANVGARATAERCKGVEDLARKGELIAATDVRDLTMGLSASIEALNLELEGCGA